MKTIEINRKLKNNKKLAIEIKTFGIAYSKGKLPINSKQ